MTGTTIEIVANDAAKVLVSATESAHLDILANTASALSVGIATPGPAGPNAIGGFTFDLNSLQTGDHLEFSVNKWVNVAKTTLADGGNF